MMKLCVLLCGLLQDLDVSLRDCREELFHCKEHLQCVKTKEKDLVAQVSRSKSTITRLSIQLTKLEKDVIKQRMNISEQACLLKHTQTQM